MASDDCGDVTWSNDYTMLSDDCGATGSATVTFTATDDCGNSSTTMATFTIEDTTAGEWEAALNWSESGWRFAEAETRRVAGGDRNVRLVIARDAPVGRLELDVVDADTGRPLDASFATLVPMDGSSMWSVPIPEREPGRVVCDGVSPGEYVVWIAVEGKDPYKLGIVNYNEKKRTGKLSASYSDDQFNVSMTVEQDPGASAPAGVKVLDIPVVAPPQKNK